MGASSAQIDQEIKDTRRELDEKLAILERRAASGARVYGRVAAVVAVGVVAVVLGVVIYRRRRDRKMVRQLHEALIDIRNLPADVISRLKDKLPIKVVVTDRAHDESAPNAWVSLAQKIAPTVVGSAAGAVASRMRGTPPDTLASE
ncbi:MAG TPA: hypothetical protein VIO34_05785 [Candidatus Dormibacteraeota bacterium]|jgi:hypothetical protein